MSTITERGQRIYDYLAQRLNQPHTLAELLAALGLENSASTHAAIRHARELATLAGLHFPPAVPRNGYVYMVTDQARPAIIPTAHMVKIGRGIARRAAIGFDHIRAQAAATVDNPRLRAVMAEAARIQAERERANAEVDARLAGLLAEAEAILAYEARAHIGG